MRDASDRICMRQAATLTVESLNSRENFRLDMACSLDSYYVVPQQRPLGKSTRAYSIYGAIVFLTFKALPYTL
jgi:hypothetical protein